METTLSKSKLNSRSRLPVNTAGSVDNEKSTFIGRLLFDSGGLAKDVIDKITRKSDADQKGRSLNFAFFSDGLREEQAKGITIDVARHFVRRSNLDLVIADTPGHQEFTRNMLTGTSTSKATLILVDATKGIVEQNRRHAYIASLLGVEQIIVLVNKMDLVGFSKDRFKNLSEEFNNLILRLGGRTPIYIPISALNGDNVVERSTSMPWYSGESVIKTLENLEFDEDISLQDLRFIVQWIDETKKPHPGPKEILGHLISGTISEGDEVIVLPSEQRTRTAKILGINGDLAAASFPSHARILLEDDLDVSRGSIITHPERAPRLHNSIRAKVCWMQEKPLVPGTPYLLQNGTKIVEATISHIRHRVDIENYNEVESNGPLELNDIAEVEIHTANQLPFELFSSNRGTGRFILIDSDSKTTAAAGIIVSL